MNEPEVHLNTRGCGPMDAKTAGALSRMFEAAHNHQERVMNEPTIPPPSEPPCKGCGQPCHPYYVRRYDGYCLDCANSGVDEAHAELAAIRDLLTPLLGTETCAECLYVAERRWCEKCHGTGRRNISDGLSVVECVKRLLADRCQKCGMGPMTRISDSEAKYCSNCINLACADEEANGLNMWKGWADESEAECDELREQVKRLRERVERRLQTCHARGICVDCEQDREVLAATAPKETAK